jgi:hypothetical protein
VQDEIAPAPDLIDLVDADAAARYAAALAHAAGSTGEAVVWHDGDSELLLRLDRVTLERREDGTILVHLPVFCEESGDAEVIVPFAVARRPGGALVAATDTVPHGPAAVVNRWGEPLVAAAWEALAEVASG